MQEMHTMGGGRFFSGGGGSGERGMRPHSNPNHQSLKCPRCESLHTKFCYYNNYNLSQPRHFCKSCRRYWTKGGVLRNVPIGGGCRKSKRSKPKSSTASENATYASPNTTTSATDTPAALPTAAAQQELKSNSHSSSESSSLTAANTASASINTTEAASTPMQNPATNHLLHMHEPRLHVNSESGIPPLEAGLLEQAADSGIFSEIGSFMSLVPSTRETLPFCLGNMPDAQPFRFNQLGSNNHLGQPNQGLKFPAITSGSTVDQTVQVDMSDLQNKSANSGSGFGSLLDWHGVGDEGLFELANHNPVDLAYWNQSYWTEHDHTSLYLP